jgi:hypothetical protein
VSFAKDAASGVYEADIKDRRVARLHLSLRTKSSARRRGATRRSRRRCGRTTPSWALLRRQKSQRRSADGVLRGGPVLRHAARRPSAGRRSARPSPSTCSGSPTTRRGATRRRATPAARSTPPSGYFGADVRLDRARGGPRRGERRRTGRPRGTGSSRARAAATRPSRSTCSGSPRSSLGAAARGSARAQGAARAARARRADRLGARAAEPERARRELLRAALQPRRGEAGRLAAGEGYVVVRRGEGDPGLFGGEPDLVCLSVIFSWHAPIAREVALRYADREVWCGGPGMFALAHWWRSETGGDGRAGLDARFERQRGDYRMTFASRGCPVGCWFCIVPKLEGADVHARLGLPPAPILCDNNLSALPATSKSTSCGATARRGRSSPTATAASSRARSRGDLRAVARALQGRVALRLRRDRRARRTSSG